MSSVFALHARRTWLGDRHQPATVFIENGKIHSVEKGKPESIACPLEDLGDAVLMPGLTDAHVHINEPGRTNWEGFDTATRTAAAGGITSLVEMPLNASPVTTSPESFQKKVYATQGKLHVNCGFWGGIVPENAGQLEPLLESGVLGIKAFLTHSGIDEFPNVTEADLRRGMAAIARSGLPLLAHCELPSPNSTSSAVRTEGDTAPRKYKTWLHSRPKSWENAAIELMMNLCREYGCRTHIVHLSSAEALPAIIAARQEGLPLTVETCPHYLFFNAENIPDADTRFKCAPPIREWENNEQLWVALGEGVIDFITTDHSPAPPAIKELESGNLMKAWGGIAGLQFLLPVTWTAAKRRGFTLKNLVNWLAEAPAVFAGFGDRKGKIAPGYDADLVVWHPEKNFTVEEEMIQFRHKITPYMGLELQGVVERTYVRGVKVFEKGKMQELNQGQVILA
jgi:allantoinase